MPMELDDTDNFMRSFNMFPNFRRPYNNDDLRIRSIKFSEDGETMISANNRHTIDFYNCNTAQQVRSVNIFKYGVSVVDYMDANDKILVGSEAPVRGVYEIRELNITNQKYETCYLGHSKPSVSLSVNTANKVFLSGGLDKSIMLFDFRTRGPEVSRNNLSGVPLVALHPWTDLCAVALDDSRIEIYDLRGLNYGPFSSFKFNYDQIQWTSLKFSSDAKQILISSNSSKIRVVNSYTGAVEQVFGSRRNMLNIAIDASFTPNNEYILSGSSDGNVLVFSNNKKSGLDHERKVAELSSHQPEAITAVEMNPKYSLMATASSYVAFWVPNDAN
ncbi:WD repeat-containing protein 82-B-like [Contarinia nasturtii]|uniref:WD repeat-containing protein 82-B-like n=1 Tax=Contarinia nasturtii TaxID=265458 RepID=UPI0012D38296|nr:WD repeat-containing protein 82-B-like [Contarinia nasturtii]